MDCSFDIPFASRNYVYQIVGFILKCIIHYKVLSLGRKSIFFGNHLSLLCHTFSGKNKYAGGNAVCDRPTPDWQKDISSFFIKPKNTEKENAEPEQTEKENEKPENEPVENADTEESERYYNYL